MNHDTGLRRTRRTIAAVGLLLGIGLGTVGLLDLRPAPEPPGRHPGATTAPAAVVPPGAGASAVEVPTPTTRMPRPTGIEIPAIDVAEPLEPRGLKSDGSFDTPDFGDASWYRLGPRPGEPGGAVVVAHVHGPDGPDVFWDLATLRPGDEIRIAGPDLVFVVDAVEQVPKSDLPRDRIWPDVDTPLLRLITCGGRRTAQGYPDNTVVYAHLRG
ncbi:MAG TPA: sortase [Acidimicrobiales bacterium]